MASRRVTYRASIADARLGVKKRKWRVGSGEYLVVKAYGKIASMRQPALAGFGVVAAGLNPAGYATFVVCNHALRLVL